MIPVPSRPVSSGSRRREEGRGARQAAADEQGLSPLTHRIMGSAPHFRTCRITAGAPQASVLRDPRATTVPGSAVLPGTTPRTQASISTVVRSPHASGLCPRGRPRRPLFEAPGFGPLKVCCEAGSLTWLDGPDLHRGLSPWIDGTFEPAGASWAPQPGALGARCSST